MADENTQKPAAAEKPAAADKAEKKKKEKPPALEDKPFAEFINQHFLPELKKTVTAQGIDDLDLKFEKHPLPMSWVDDQTPYWQILGRWQDGKRQFILVFQKEDISGPKFLAVADNGTEPTTLESFMIDERKVNLDLMIFYVLQRLNGQKWLVRN